MLLQHHISKVILYFYFIYFILFYFYLYFIVILFLFPELLSPYNFSGFDTLNSYQNYTNVVDDAKWKEYGKNKEKIKRQNYKR
jgi:hypothetical protein